MYMEVTKKHKCDGKSRVFFLSKVEEKGILGFDKGLISYC